MHRNEISKFENKTTSTANIVSEWLTRSQASKYLQIGISTLDAKIPIKKYKIGKSIRYLKKDIDDYLLAHCVEPLKKGE